MSAARTEQGLSTRALARALTDAGFPVSYQRVSDYERGTVPTERYVRTLERVLGLDEGALTELWREARGGQLRRRQGSEGTTAAATSTPDRTPTRSVPFLRRRTARIASFAGLGVVAVIATIVVISMRSVGDSSESPPHTASEGTAPGGSDDGPAGVSCVPIGQGNPTFGPPFVEAFEAAGGGRALGCAINGIHDWGPGQIQDLRGGLQGRGAIMAMERDHVIVITGDSWIAYEETVGPGSTGPVAGYPVTVDEPCPGGRLMQLDGGSAGPGGLFRREDNGLWIWVYGPIWSQYLERGGPDGELGLPTQMVITTRGGVSQAFDGGVISVAVEDVPAAPPASPNPPQPLCGAS